MKTLNVLIMSLCTTVGLAVTSLAAENPERPYLGHVNLVRGFDNTILIADGFTAEQVKQKCGKPHEVLPGNVWLYRLYASDVNETARQHNADTVLVSFSDGSRLSRQKVCAIVMVNIKGIGYAISELQRNPVFLSGRFAHTTPASGSIGGGNN